jgi:hypothetical protein
MEKNLKGLMEIFVEILWRFCTLVLRIAWYSLVSLVNQNAKVSRDAYYFSVVALIVGKPREF